MLFRLATVVGKGVFYLEYRSHKTGFSKLDSWRSGWRGSREQVLVADEIIACMLGGEIEQLLAYGLNRLLVEGVIPGGIGVGLYKKYVARRVLIHQYSLDILQADLVVKLILRSEIRTRHAGKKLA